MTELSLVTVVTVVKDDSAGLARTFLSLSQQTHMNWVMVIVVGESSDGTIELARELVATDTRVKYVRQNDLGIYQAMNLGIKHLVGDFSWFMNSGDIFANKAVLRNAVAEISKTKCSILIGGYQISSETHSTAYVYKAQKITTLRYAFSLRMSHQAMIFRNSSLLELGPYNTRYTLASDFDLVLRITGKYPVRRIDELWGIVEPGGAADQGIDKVHLEKMIIREEFFRSKAVNVLSLIWTYSAKAKRRIKPKNFREHRK